MNVETLTATLEVGGLGAYRSQMETADRITQQTKASLGGVNTASVAAAESTTKLGNASSVAASAHSRNARELNGLEREARGATASFTGLGRAMFFASNAFLGGAIVGGVLKGIVDATRSAQESSDTLRKTVENTGASWQAYGAQIDSVIAKQSDLSKFTKSEVTDAMNRLVLATGSVEKAETALNLATNLARATHEDLATAVTQVTQAETGRLTTIRGLGIAIPKVTTAEDDLKNKVAALKAAHEAATPASLRQAEAQAKLADQSATAARMVEVLTGKVKGADATFAGSSSGGLANFQRSINDLEIALGKVLLPEIDQLVEHLSRWIEKLQQTGQAQRDAKEAATALKDAFDAVKTVIDAVDKVTGGFKQTLELLIGLKFAPVIAGWASNMKDFAGASALGAATSESSTLLGTLGKLKALGPIAVTIALSLIPKAASSSNQNAPSNNPVAKFFAGLPVVGGLFSQANRVGDAIDNALGLTGGGSGGGMTAQQIINSQAGKINVRTGLPLPASITGFANPVPGAAYARVDQGTDYVAKQAVQAIGAGIITSITKGMAGGTGDIIKEHLLHAIKVNGRSYSNVYYSEQKPLVHSGQGVRAGTPVMGPGGNEIGFLDASGNMAPLVGGLGPGTKPTQMGSDFAAFVKSLGGAGPSGGGGGAGAGAGSTGSSGSGLVIHSTFKPKKPKPPPLIPQSLQDAVSRYGDLAKNLSDSGSKAKAYLDDELHALQQEQSHLDGLKQTDKVKKALTQVENAIRDVQRKIADAIIVQGAALLPENLRTTLTSLTKQGSADADLMAVLTGDTQASYAGIIKANLLAQTKTLTAEVASLKKKLESATGKQKTAIQAELTNVQDALSTVQQSVLANLQGTVQTLQSKVSTLFASVQSQLDTALGNLFYQNGLQTPSEKLLAQMQQQDQLGGLQDALQAAKDTLAKDTSTLSRIVFDSATGLITDVFDQAGTGQLASDQKAVAAAQRQIDEYNLSIKASQERSAADSAYATQVDSLNKKLATLAAAVENGTGSISDLKGIAAAFGLSIDTQTVPDFKDLSSAAGDLKQAFKDLVDYIATITGKTPPPQPNTSGHPPIINQIPAQFLPAAAAAVMPGPTRNGGAVPMASGGVIRARPGGTLVRAAEAGHDEAFMPLDGRGLGGSTVVHLNVQALDPASVNWDTVTDQIHAALLRKQKRNSGTLGLN